jgi:hypothetical protein
VIFYATASGPAVRAAMDAGQIGHIHTPISGHRVPAGRDWCADNAVYAGTYPGDDAYLAWLERHRPVRRWCRFATAPDVVGDAEATLARSAPRLARIRAAGYPVALVAQDGLEDRPVPWDSFDALFLGGTTEWKLGAGARKLVGDARHHAKWVHMGRVNSQRRFVYAATIGCDSADGTILAFGPDVNLRRVQAWRAATDNMLPLPAAAW